MLETSSTLESTRANEATCLSLAIGLHALFLLWNPIVLKSNWQPAHDFVTVDVVEQPVAGSAVENEPKPKMSLMDTLKDMLMKPKSEEIAHVAPEPVVPRVAAPIQPALQERNMPRPIATAFQPQSQAEDLAMANAPNQINTTRTNVPNVPIGGPTLTAKSFGGIRAKDLPFQVGGGDAIATGGQSVIPVAIGNNSAKAALAYGSPTLSDAKTPHMGIVPTNMSGASDLNSIGAGAASTIQLSGTGGTGNAPTGAASGSSLHDRAGSGGGFVSKAMFGSGQGSGYAGGIESMPSAAQELDNQLAASAGTGTSAAKKNKGFDIAGPLNNRPIVHKVIPQYPAWAEEQGIIGSVRLYFTVTPEGTVRTNIRVTKTTGYPQLDQLGIDALKQWQFSPVSSDDEGKGEWGIITFTFSLSS